MPVVLQWCVLAALSAVLAAFLTWLAFPAALLLGPMVAGIIFAFHGGTLQVGQTLSMLGQGVLGCVIARSMPLTVSAELLLRWPLFVTIILSVVLVSAMLGWIMTRLRVLPGTTVVWGISPGAATVMTLMAESAGADAQLVAFMQYSRIIIAAGVASAVAKWTGIDAAHGTAAAEWFPAVDWLALAQTLGLAISGPLVARVTGVRGAALLVPLLAAIVLAHYGILEIELPRWLLVVVYAFLGWRIGLRFTRSLLLHALKSLPGILASSFALIIVCAGIAALLVVFADIDPLTAYLATSPGGADTVAIIATSSNADVAFVMTTQMFRFVIVLLLGPVTAKFVASRSA
ncbi:membrane protein AbrB duplication [Hartmannibacter diazotrophicus]|uniref:Membrane protein AbrB duplication n=2 Tax=Hartmannibacter diazotrophicus TaxID=1482074 RepID=A0A2C9D0Q1_9HYPH|nr:membrane protein AbrB duplication [Hartmannibacter diazotrophicus]